MDLVESERQISQMISFILNEAKDKSEELEARSLEDFNVEKLKSVQASKASIRDEYASKLKQAETAAAIARSTSINAARLKKIEARQQCLVALKQLCESELKKITGGSQQQYAQLQSDLICQGCLKLMEDEVVVKCRKEDEGVTKQAMDLAARKFSEVLSKECGVSKSVRLSLSGSFLPSVCGGGVVLSCCGNTISIDNTLNTRLNLVMDTEIPDIRKLLFKK